MSLNCGIVGLPNVGKSTIFKALTSAPAEAANYPFCTIEPNVGIVSVGDARLGKIATIVHPEKVIPASMEFVDIAGLVKGASKGEGLGNQFLGHIRQVNAVAHVVRCFIDDDVVHVAGKVSPAEDIETINFELALADLEAVERKITNLPKMIKSQDKEVSKKAKAQQPVLERLKTQLEEGKSAAGLVLEDDDVDLVKELNLITLKKMIYVCNVDEDSLERGNEYVDKVREIAQAENSEVVVICGKLESEIALLDTLAERREFMDAANIKESGLDILTKTAYKALGLNTYFTSGVKEVRAWTFKSGAKAPQAAGIIHSDFERGFIKAEVYHCDDLFKFGSEAKVKEAGKFRIEGKEYTVMDGDIMHFRFNV